MLHKRIPFHVIVLSISFLLFLLFLYLNFGIRVSGEGEYPQVTLKNKAGQTWVMTGYWGEIDGQRVFYPVPPTQTNPAGQIWVDASHYERKQNQQKVTETTTVLDEIKTPTMTLRQKEAGDHRLIMTVNNPNYFTIVASVKLVSKTPDAEVANLTEQKQENVTLPPGDTELTFDSVKRHEGQAKYDVDIRVTENRHPNVHPDYKTVRNLGKIYTDTPVYIAFKVPEVTLESNHAGTPSTFGTNWTFRNPNTIDYAYKAEIIDARGTKTVKTGTIKAGEMISGSEIAIPSTASTNTQTFKVTFDPDKASPMPKVNSASFTFIVANAGLTLNASTSDKDYETKSQSISTGCAYGSSPSNPQAHYVWKGASYTVTSTVTNNSNFPIVVTVTVDGKSGTYTLAEYASTSGPSTSGDTHDAKTIKGSATWSGHTTNASTTISVRGWVETGRDSYTCNPPPPPPPEN